MTEPAARLQARRRRRNPEPAATTARHRLPDLAALSGILAESGELQGLAERLATAASGRVGQALRHTT